MAMKKTLFNKYDKKWIAKLPQVAFQGRIFVVVSPHETKRVVDFLLTNPILGMDTETRPSFKKGRLNIVSLLQVATREVCFLFRLQFTGITPDIVRLLEDETVPKVGLSLHDDINSLNKRKTFKPGKFIDLQNHFNELGVEDLGLQKLYANVFGQKISKAQQRSNWEADVLTEKQKLYAATDAWACIMLYDEYIRLRDTGDFILQKVEEPEAEEASLPTV